ncbi:MULTISPECIES: 3-coathanger stack domain-containing protein [Emticicia]|uniref:immunoglobulin domain-containing protein n=1 Tax=Emticicia TaxID=312278 RepID=UPI0007D89F8E|nr:MULTISPECIES: 3-coathanger stack domain-containing protein [Emticicia]
MKNNFTKSIFGILAVICLLLSSNLIFAQATWLSSGNFTATYASSNETIKVTNSAGSVGGGNVVKGYANNNTGDITANAGYGAIPNAFTNAPTAQLFKATAGKPFTITLEFDLQNAIFGGTESTITMLQSGLGKNDQNYSYDQFITIPQTSAVDVNGRKRYVFTGTYTFPVGRTQAWLVFGFRRSLGNPNDTRDNMIILPFVVEGAYNDISEANKVKILGRFREPAIPQMILHNPPGDMSSVTFQTAQEACRNMSESLTTEESNTGKLNVTLGIAGSAGLFVTTNFEFSVTASVSGGGGSTAMRSNGQQNCVSILNAISTIPGSAPVNQGSIYLGYSSDIDYGVFPSVIINTSPTLTIVKDSSLIFGVVPNSAAPFYYSKSDILADIAQRQTIIDNLATLPKIRYEAQSQINIWRQVLAKDSININNPNAEVITPSFTLTGNSSSISNSVTQSVSTSETYDVSHFLELGAGVSFVVKVGGSGVDGGYEFKTKKTLGTSVSNSNNSSTTIAYTLQDNDAGDIFKVKIIKDKTYGTPIFLLDHAQSRTSCPYEGGYQRDQPSLQIVGSAQNNITIPNVTLGTPASFQVKLCNNNSTEARSYNLGFVPQTNLNDLLISAAGSSGSQFGPFTIPANGCRIENYDVNIARRFPASGVNFSNLELELYTACEPSIKSSIIANVSFAAPPAAVVTTNNTEVCSGSPVTLTATCPVNYAINWYTSFTGGFVVASGSSVSLSPTANTVYYVGCESTNHVPPRVASKLVLVGSPSTVLNLTSNFTTSTLQIANTTIIANNKIFSPASVTYKAGKSLSFNPGFEAKAGSNFMARIGGCGN